MSSRHRLPNDYLPDLIEQSGEATVRAILESHFISPAAFDILLRDPFGPDDFEAFIAERQRTSAGRDRKPAHQGTPRLPPQLRDLDAATERSGTDHSRILDTIFSGDAPMFLLTSCRRSTNGSLGR